MYTFTYEDGDGTTITHESTEEFLPDLLQEIRLFLLGCGFHPDNVNSYIEWE